MNMMRKSRSNPNISAHEQLFGIFNSNCTAFAPTVKIIIVHEKTGNRSTYAPNGSERWYIGRAPLQYRLFICYMKSIKSKRTSDNYDFFPRHFDIAKTSSVDVEAMAASQLIHAFKTQHRNHH